MPCRHKPWTYRCCVFLKGLNPKHLKRAAVPRPGCGERLIRQPGLPAPGAATSPGPSDAACAWRTESPTPLHRGLRLRIVNPTFRMRPFKGGHGGLRLAKRVAATVNVQTQEVCCSLFVTVACAWRSESPTPLARMWYRYRRHGYGIHVEIVHGRPFTDAARAPDCAWMSTGVMASTPWPSR